MSKVLQEIIGAERFEKLKDKGAGCVVYGQRLDSMTRDELLAVFGLMDERREEEIRRERVRDELLAMRQREEHKAHKLRNRPWWERWI